MSADESQHLLAKVKVLLQTPVEGWTTLGARRLNDDPWGYLLPVTGSLLVFLSRDGDRLVIEDFVRQETLDRFFAARKAPASAP
jgi:hypothetical protein